VSDDTVSSFPKGHPTIGDLVDVVVLHGHIKLGNEVSHTLEVMNLARPSLACHAISYGLPPTAHKLERGVAVRPPLSTTTPPPTPRAPINGDASPGPNGNKRSWCVSRACRPGQGPAA